MYWTLRREGFDSLEKLRKITTEDWQPSRLPWGVFYMLQKRFFAEGGEGR